MDKLSLLSQALGFHQLNNLDEAEILYQKILAEAPDDFEVLNFLALLNLQKDKLNLAETLANKAISLHACGYYYATLAKIHSRNKDYKNAINALKAAIELDTNDFEHRFNLGLAYKKDNQFEEAITAYLEALQINPNSQDAQFNLAYLYIGTNNPRKAIECYNSVLSSNPDDLESKYFLSLAYFQVKNYDKGFELFENRLCKLSSTISQQKIYPNIMKTAKLWHGEDISDKTIYTYYEAGFGDIIMYSRYFPILAKRCKKLIFKPQKELLPLFLENPLGSTPVGFVQEQDIDFDLFTPILSIPYFLGLKGDDVFASPKGYMSANPDKTKVYKEKYFNNKKFKIVIKWQGNTYYDTGRVIDVASFFRLFDIPNTQFYSAQTFEGAQELSKLSENYEIIDLGKTFNDFSDTAAALENADLVICNDTSLGHLAGALGKKCWILLPYVYNWRWHRDLSHCDWYDSVKLFRQDVPDDWSGVFDRVYEELSCLCK